MLQQELDSVFICRPMFRLIKYVVRTVATEIQENYEIVKYIIKSHIQTIKQEIELYKRKRQIRVRLSNCHNYDEWLEVAQEFDNLPPNVAWREKVHSDFYDYKYIEDLLALMTSYRKKNQMEKLISLLRSHSFRNIGNITSPALYAHCFHRTKTLIQKFQKEITKSLEAILRSTKVTQDKKLQFFGEMRHAIGRTALLLSGGAVFGFYHVGVIMALSEAKLIPKILAGSSAGSMISSFYATRIYKHQLFTGQDIIFPSRDEIMSLGLIGKIKNYLKTGYFLDIKLLEKSLKANIGDVTFRQAFDQTGCILNITVTGVGQHDSNRLLNYLTAPNVLIWSACAASCAIPLVFGATPLYCKNPDGSIEPYVPFDRKFVDGSIGHDLPMNQMSVFYNVNSFIVSQTNPWVIPFMDYTQEWRFSDNTVLIKIFTFLEWIKQLFLSQIKHRSVQATMLGLLPSLIARSLNLITQEYTGNITIWPTLSLQDYLHIMESPSSYEQMKRFVDVGRNRTYPKISLIRASMHFEQQVQRCFKKAKYLSMSRLNLSRIISQDFEDDKINEAEDEQDQQLTFVRKRMDSERRINKFGRNTSFINPSDNIFKKASGY